MEACDTDIYSGSMQPGGTFSKEMKQLVEHALSKLPEKQEESLLCGALKKRVIVRLLQR